MKKNMKAKLAAIVGFLLICLYGIFGIPKGVTGGGAVEPITQRIHLGLDLQGGAHLVLQVMVKDAVNAETDNTVARLQQDMATNRFQGTPTKPDPNNPQVMEITGVDPAKAGDMRNV